MEAMMMRLNSRKRAAEAEERRSEGMGFNGAAPKVVEKAAEVNGDRSPVSGHPYDFNVSGPRNLSSPNWRELFVSSWRDPNYKRTVIACFIQAVYLLELDRQEGRRRPDEVNDDVNDALAPKWWKPFKYKLVGSLVDPRDGSIYAAVLEWDRAAAAASLVLMRPGGAPRAVLVLRGTLLRGPTARRDIEDDLRFLAWESLKGSARFDGALEALRSISSKYGAANVCVGGHSLGAGFALQVGKALAKEGVFIECHLFNPPSFSMAMSFRVLGEKAGSAWERIRASLPYVNGGGLPAVEKKNKTSMAEAGKWAPNLYVNDSDYICCHYNAVAEGEEEEEKEKVVATGSGSRAAAAAAARMFVISKGPKRFLEAHGLEQWWSDDLELREAIHRSKLIERQLRSLYAAAETPAPAKS